MVEGMLEREIESYFRKQVEAAGGLALKFVSPSHRGVSDRIVCFPGETWFVELKRPGGRLSPLQKVFAAEMARLGQNYTYLSSKEEIDKWLMNGLTPKKKL
jgi:hypothetical protein